MKLKLHYEQTAKYSIEMHMVYGSYFTCKNICISVHPVLTYFQGRAGHNTAKTPRQVQMSMHIPASAHPAGHRRINICTQRQMPMPMCAR